MSTKDFINQLASEGAKKPMPQPLKLAAKWTLLMLGYLAAIALILGMRPDMPSKLEAYSFLLEQLIAIAAGIAALLATAFLALPDTGQKPWVRYLPLVLIGGMIATLGYSIFSGSAMSLSECLSQDHMSCIIELFLFSLAPGALLFAALKKAAPYYSGWAGAMVGLSAGCFGYVLLRLTEAADDATVLTVWHLLPVLALTLLCVWLGRINLRSWGK